MDTETIEAFGIKLTRTELNQALDTIKSPGFKQIQRMMDGLRDYECVDSLLASAPPNGFTMSEYMLSISGMTKAFALFSMLPTTVQQLLDEFKSNK